MVRKGLSKTAGIVIAIIIIIIIAVAAYYATQKPTPTTTTPTTSPTTSPSPSVAETTTSPTQTTSPTTTETTPTTSPTTSPTTTPTTTPKPAKPFHMRMIYIINNDPVPRINMLQSGTADAAAIPIENIPDVEGYTMGNYKIVVEKGLLEPSIVYVVLNCNKAPFNNTLVRQALAYAVPYEVIIQTVYEGYLKPLHGIIPYGFLGYTTYNIINYTAIPYEERLNKAKELLQKAGIDPTQYTFEIWYNAGNTQREKIATLLSESWGKLGFKTSTRSLEWPVYLSKVENGEFDVYIIGWAPDYLDPDNYVGPLFYGGTRFKEVNVNMVQSADEIGNYVKNAVVFDTEKYYVVVGEKGTGATVSVSGKPFIVVSYIVDEEATKPIENSTGFVDIDPAFYRNTTVDALAIAGRREANPEIREAIYNALFQASNKEVPIILLGQYVLVRPYWNWLHGRYYHPTLAERYDLLYEDADAPTVNTGIKDYVNDPYTYVVATIGWPDTFDPAFNYETFGWAIFHNIGDTLVTYWKEETKEVSPDLAVAWVHNADATEWYFVIRGGVKAYDPWHDKTYDISALDVLFTIWRVARLEGDPSWMVTEFIDTNNSKVYTEEEFDQILKNNELIAEYKGQSKVVKSLNELLDFFGYKGETAGVVYIKLYYPYGPILSILADPFLMVIPAQYLFDNIEQLQGKYEEAMNAAEWGKNPAAWAQYIGKGENEPTHQYLHKFPVGTGPYYVKEYVEGSHIVLEYNPYYWNTTLWEELYGFKP